MSIFLRLFAEVLVSCLAEYSLFLPLSEAWASSRHTGIWRPPYNLLQHSHSFKDAARFQISPTIVVNHTPFTPKHSLQPTMLFASALVGALFAANSLAHMQLDYPAPFNASNNPNRATDTYDEYLQFPYDNAGPNARWLYPCRGYEKLIGTPEGAPTATWEAGSTQKWQVIDILGAISYTNRDTLQDHRWYRQPLRRLLSGRLLHRRRQDISSRDILRGQLPTSQQRQWSRGTGF